MMVELNDETERLLREQLDSGHFTSIDEVLASALTELAMRNAKLNRQRLAIQESAGAWKDEDHPELIGRSAAWVRRIRAESNDRTQVSSDTAAPSNEDLSPRYQILIDSINDKNRRAPAAC